jgi:hypothetical protein
MIIKVDTGLTSDIAICLVFPRGKRLPNYRYYGGGDGDYHSCGCIYGYCQAVQALHAYGINAWDGCNVFNMTKREIKDCGYVDIIKE